MESITSDLRKISTSAAKTVFNCAREAGLDQEELHAIGARMGRWVKTLERYEGLLAEARASRGHDGKKRRRVEQLFKDRDDERRDIFGDDNMAGVGDLLE